jgi:hypothetical protein
MWKQRQNSGMELQKVLIRRRMLMQQDDSIAEMGIGRGTRRASERERERMLREGEREETEIAMADDEVRGGHNDSRREKQAPGNDVWSLV